MRTIFKYSIKLTDEQRIEMNTGAKILCVQLQGGQPCIWAEVEDPITLESVPIFIIGTGNPMPIEATRYIGTVQQFNGGLIWHVYTAQ